MVTMVTLATVFPIRIVQRKFSRFSKYSWSAWARRLPVRACWRMRSRLNVNTPASMPDIRNDTPRQTPKTNVSRPGMLLFLHRFHQQFAHAPFAGDMRAQLQASKHGRLPRCRDHFHQAYQQSAHRIHVPRLAQLRALTAKSIEGHRPIDPPASFPQLFHDKSLRFDLLADLADDFLQDILSGNQSSGTAKLIQHHGQPALLALEALEQLKQIHALRHKRREL